MANTLEELRLRSVAIGRAVRKQSDDYPATMHCSVFLLSS